MLRKNFSGRKAARRLAAIDRMKPPVQIIRHGRVAVSGRRVVEYVEPHEEFVIRQKAFEAEKRRLILGLNPNANGIRSKKDRSARGTFRR